MSSLTLVLLRHAKAEQQGPPTQGDHGRPLAERGVADARKAGATLAELGPVPDLVLCSTAVRTLQTWEAMVDGGSEVDQDRPESPGPLSKVEVWRDRRIYNASPDALLQVLADVPDEARVVAMVGHAPGIPALVGSLLDPDDPSSATPDDFLSTFPTMTSVVLHSERAAGVPEPGSMALLRAYGSRG
ncbi:histidine phosphatase family protein [soil metagenome]